MSSTNTSEAVLSTGLSPNSLFDEAAELLCILEESEVDATTGNRVVDVVMAAEAAFAQQIEAFYDIEPSNNRSDLYVPEVILDHVIAPGIRFDHLLYERAAPNGDFQRGRALYFYNDPVQPYVPSWGIVQARRFTTGNESVVQTLTPTLYSTSLIQSLHDRLVAAQNALYEEYAAEVASTAPDTRRANLQLIKSEPDV